MRYWVYCSTQLCCWFPPDRNLSGGNDLYGRCTRFEKTFRRRRPLISVPSQRESTCSLREREYLLPHRFYMIHWGGRIFYMIHWGAGGVKLQVDRRDQFGRPIWGVKKVRQMWVVKKVRQMWVVKTVRQMWVVLERDTQHMGVEKAQRETEKEREGERKRERERQSVSAWEREWVWERKRERASERESACGCVCERQSDSYLKDSSDSLDRRGVRFDGDDL